MTDMWSLALDDKDDLQRLSCRSLPRRIDKVGLFTQTYNATEQLSSFACESGTCHASLWACPQRSRKEHQEIVKFVLSFSRVFPVFQFWKP